MSLFKNVIIAGFPRGFHNSLLSGNILGTCSFCFERLDKNYSTTNRLRDAKAKVPAKTGFVKKYLSLALKTTSAPFAPLLFGVSGLIPFYYPPVMMIYQASFSDDLMFMHLAYAATILSFLGGVRWGYCLSPSSETNPNLLNLGYSVSPQLIGWGSLLLPNVPGSALLLIVSLTACAVFDAKMPGYPSWFLGLRIFLTTGAVFSLIISLACMLVFKYLSK